MSEDEDLELQALQRQLDDAFQTTRPRPGFEDELWLRMQSRRPSWQRLRAVVAGRFAGIKPAVPSAAVAVGLVVLLGAGIYTLSGLGHGGGPASVAGGASTSQTAPGAPVFGRVPRPGFAQALPVPQNAIAGAATEFDGPVNLVWAGSLQVNVSALPVYRYVEPTRADADRFAAAIGAVPSNDVAQGGIGVYAGRDFTLVVLASVQSPPLEPYFNVSDLKKVAPPGSDSVIVATAYLTAHHLLPTWPYQTQVQTIGTAVRTSFLRYFDVPGLGVANLVNSAGDRYGTDVDFVPGTTGAFEHGPLPLPLESATYPIISADQAIRSLGASSAPASSTIPVVRITQAELVYTVVWGGDHSYYEPAYLFSGTFSNHGVASIKRVLMPAVVPSLLSP